ncbi:hypothetical protein ACFLS1_01955 [Verrucomicrobiota bacterium]
MKIPLGYGNNSGQSGKAAQAKMLERDITKAKQGDWEAKKNLVRTFSHLLNSLAQKRSDKPAKINQYVEAGKNGLYTAAKKYKINNGPKGFQIFALDHIEAAMDRSDKSGFFSRLFGR